MLGSGLLIPMRNQGKGGPGYTAEALTLFAAMTTPPTEARKVVINNTIVLLQTSGVWALIDCLYMLAAHSDTGVPTASQAARLNWKNPGTNTLALVSTPTFLADRGYTGNGVDQGLNNGPNFATLGGNFSLNSAHLGIWCGTDVIENVADGGAVNAVIRTRANATQSASRLNDGTTTFATLPVGSESAIGLTLMSRTSAAEYDAYKNSISYGPIAPDSTAITSANMVVCFVGTLWSTKRIQAVIAGGGLSAAQQLGAYTALNYYMTAVGAV